MARRPCCPAACSPAPPPLSPTRLAADGPSPVLPSRLQPSAAAAQPNAAAAQPSAAAAQFFFFFSLARKTGGLLTRGLVPKTLLLRPGTSIWTMGESTKKLMTQKRTQLQSARSGKYVAAVLPYSDGSSSVSHTAP